MTEPIKYTPAPTIKQFHLSDAPVRGIMGPIGSGKSTGCCMEVLARAMRQKPNPSGIRRSRWAVVRNSYPELRVTTIKTWQEWIPPSMCRILWKAPIEGHICTKLADKTILDAEVFFIALDKPQDVRKLLSLELTGAWVNEAREMDESIVRAAYSRTGRFPSKVDSAEITWSGVIMDTNPCDDDHWWYRLAEDVQPKGWRFFRQPGALIPILNETGRVTTYEANPLAENVEHQPLGYQYWMRLTDGADPEWVLVHCCGQYGSVFDGKPVYMNVYNDAVHVAQEPLGVYRGRPLFMAYDFGLTPACLVGQLTPMGQLRVLRELVCTRGGLKQFVTDAVKPMLAQLFPGMPVIVGGDPAGKQKSQADDELTCFGQLETLGLPGTPAATNDLLPRRQAVMDRLTRMAGDSPAFILDPSCKVLRRGFLGGYKFERVQLSGEERYRDQPAKNKYSHCIAEGTDVATVDGPVPIEQVRPGTDVLTPLGPRPVLRAWKVRDDADVREVVTDDGRRLRATGDHRIWANGRWTRVDFLHAGDILEGVSSHQQGEKAWAVRTSMRFKSSRAFATTGSRTGTMPRSGESTVAGTCIGMSGNTITDRSRRVATSIILTGTEATTPLRISAAYRSAHTTHGMDATDVLETPSRPNVRSAWHRRPRLNGTALRKALSSTVSWEERHGKVGRRWHLAVPGAARATWRTRLLSRPATALLRAKEWLARKAAWMTRTESAPYAAPSSVATSTPGRRLAPRVVGVRLYPSRVAVYNLEIEEAHCFYANGLLVKNCHDALQYLCLLVDDVTGSRRLVEPPPPVPTWAAMV